MISKRPESRPPGVFPCKVFNPAGKLLRIIPPVSKSYNAMMKNVYNGIRSINKRNIRYIHTFKKELEDKYGKESLVQCTELQIFDPTGQNNVS